MQRRCLFGRGFGLFPFFGRRHDFKEVPPRVEYSITPFGAEFAFAPRPLCEWGTRHIKRIGGLLTQIVAWERFAPVPLSATHAE